MANIAEPTEKQVREWNRWVRGRPAAIQDVIRKHGLRPWKLYRMTDTGHRVTLYSFGEDGTVTVNVTGQYNALTIDRRVFGIDPAELTECDLPGDGEVVGTMYQTDEEQLGFINKRRAELGNPPLTLEELNAMRDNRACAMHGGDDDESSAGTA